jgi:6-phosphofructo-2-kinase / fructose-2,6-biphosphatase 3
MTYEAMATEHAEEYEARQKDKLGYRYPGGGESYVDVIERVKPLILELERIRDPVVIIAHQAVLRTLLGACTGHCVWRCTVWSTGLLLSAAYFTDASLQDMVHLKIPLHAIIQLEPAAYDCNQTVIELGPSVAVTPPFTPKAGIRSYITPSPEE